MTAAYGRRARPRQWNTDSVAGPMGLRSAWLKGMPPTPAADHGGSAGDNAGAEDGADARMAFTPPRPVSLSATLRPLRRGRGDPSTRIGADGFWRASRTPEGAVTLHLTRAPGAAPGIPGPSALGPGASGATPIIARAWGPGARWAVAHAPELCGGYDDDSSFHPLHPVVRELHRRMPGLRMCRSSAVTEALVPTILEQKVTGIEARRAYQGLLRRFGEPAPGPARLVLPPSPATIARLGTAAFHRLGVERKRADTIRLACSYAHRLEEIVDMDGVAAVARLTALPGVGPWTAAEVMRVALGDPDAVSVGDYHLHDQVGWALAGEPRATDERMLELLEPFRGHRARVTALIEAAPIGAPRYGPRLTPGAIAAI